MAKTITKERQEQLTNRLVLNFGVLLTAALIMLYVNNALRSVEPYPSIAYTTVLVFGIIGIVGAVLFFVLGKTKYPKLKNYSALFLGMLIVCVMIYVAKLNLIPGYTNITAVSAVYIVMAVYFIVMAIITAVLLKRPLEKAEKGDKKHAKKKKRK